MGQRSKLEAERGATRPVTRSRSEERAGDVSFLNAGSDCREKELRRPEPRADWPTHRAWLGRAGLLQGQSWKQSREQPGQ